MDEKKPSIQPITTKSIAFSIAKSFNNVGKNVRGMVLSDDEKAKTRHLKTIERELETSVYWFSVLMSDADRSGRLLNGVLRTTHDILDVTTSTVRILRHQRQQIDD